MNEIKEIDAIINLYKDDVCDGLRNKLMIYINSHYIAKEKVKTLKMKNSTTLDGEPIYEEYDKGYNQAVGELNNSIDLMMEDNK